MDPKRHFQVRQTDLDLNDLARPSHMRPPQPHASDRPISRSNKTASTPEPVEVAGPFVRNKPPLSREAKVQDDEYYDYMDENERRGPRRDHADEARKIYKRYSSHSQRSSRSSSHSKSRERDDKTLSIRDNDDDRELERSASHLSSRNSNSTYIKSFLNNFTKIIFTSLVFKSFLLFPVDFS